MLLLLLLNYTKIKHKKIENLNEIFLSIKSGKKTFNKLNLFGARHSKSAANDLYFRSKSQLHL